METVVKLAMVLVSLSFVLKLTGYKLRQLLLMALLCALFVGFSWQFAAEQSKTAIASWLSDRELMQDIAVLMTLDVALQMAYCLMAVNLMNSGPLKRRTIFVYKLLRLFPGIMVFLVLFSLLVSCVFAFPGVSFSLISWCMAAAVLVLLPLAVLGVRNCHGERHDGFRECGFGGLPCHHCRHRDCPSRRRVRFSAVPHKIPEVMTSLIYIVSAVEVAKDTLI